MEPTEVNPRRPNVWSKREVVNRHSEYRKKIEAVGDNKRKAILQEVLRSWVRAIQVSRYPDPGRKKHWLGLAGEREISLREQLGYKQNANAHASVET